jgi:hypothetical protein
MKTATEIIQLTTLGLFGVALPTFLLCWLLWKFRKW